MFCTRLVLDIQHWVETLHNENMQQKYDTEHEGMLKSL